MDPTSAEYFSEIEAAVAAEFPERWATWQQAVAALGGREGNEKSGVQQLRVSLKDATPGAGSSAAQQQQRVADGYGGLAVGWHQQQPAGMDKFRPGGRGHLLPRGKAFEANYVQPALAGSQGKTYTVSCVGSHGNEATEFKRCLSTFTALCERSEP